MVPRERVIAAIEHKNPDRLPVDLLVGGFHAVPGG